MNILVTGATGLIGKKLVYELVLAGHENIRILTRDVEKAREELPLPLRFHVWNPSQMTIDEDALKEVDIIYHLAGENIASARWSKKQKEKILNSRKNSTRLLVDTINRLDIKVQKFISASAIGIYGNTGKVIIDEESSYADDFLANVCKSWEEELKNLKDKNIKTYFVRTGIVLAREGGALAKMLPAFNMGVAGILGSGKQYMSWIHIQDLTRIYLNLLSTSLESGPINATAPNPVTNKEFTKRLGSALSRPTLLPAPAFALKIALGELSTLLLDGQRVMPMRLIDSGFEFKYSTLKCAFEELLNEDKIFEQLQWIDWPVTPVFDFFSDEKNLENITPDSLSFKVLNKSTENIEKGTIINYRLSLYGLPFKWRTEISEFNSGESFKDIQLKGPYKKWEHTHGFIPYQNGTLMTDHVRYQVPLGSIGSLVAGAFVRRDIQKIFNYRKKSLANFFSK